MENVRIAEIKTTEIDGPGHRIELVLAGCAHNCKGCHAAKLQDDSKSCDLTHEIICVVKNYITRELSKHPFTSGITITGGDPFYKESRRESLYMLIEAVKDAWKQATDSKLNIIVYTGYTIEELVDFAKSSDGNNSYYTGKVLKEIDYLIDGKFEIDKRIENDKNLFFGSSNQRIMKINDYVTGDIYPITAIELIEEVLGDE